MNQLKLVTDFIEQCWNYRNFDLIQEFVHPDFTDHSLPPALPANLEGTKQWIYNTGLSFEHQTLIDEHVTEADKCMIKIRMLLKHTGIWRDIEPTGLDLEITGYRFFKFRDGKIVEHWALIDGQTIENLLKNAAHGCKIAQ